MNNQQEQYVCGRNENPETCFLCEQEGKDYCMICADGFTLEEYKQTQRVIVNNKRRSKEMKKNYIERQAECGLKVGDAVKIFRKAEDGEDGWDNDWPKNMDTWVGKTGKITGDGKGSGFKVFCEEENNWWSFPYFVLEKVEEKKLTS